MREGNCSIRSSESGGIEDRRLQVGGSEDRCLQLASRGVPGTVRSAAEGESQNNQARARSAPDDDIRLAHEHEPYRSSMTPVLP